MHKSKMTKPSWSNSPRGAESPILARAESGDRDPLRDRYGTPGATPSRCCSVERRIASVVAQIRLNPFYSCLKAGRVHAHS